MKTIKESLLLSLRIKNGLVPLLGLSALLANAHASVQDELATARVEWIAGDASAALVAVEAALALDSSNEEANFLAGIFELAAVFEDSLFAALLESGGLSNYSADVFDFSFDADYYLEPGQANDASWFYQTDEFTTDGDALQSGLVFDDQASILRATVSGAGLLSFDFKTSTEGGYDFLEFYIDGQLKLSRSGVMAAWENFSVLISEAGEHELVWVYTRDNIFGEGQDTVWIDNIQFPSAPLSIEPGSLKDGGDLGIALSSDFSTPGIEVPSLVPVFDETFSSAAILNWMKNELLPTLELIDSRFTQITSESFLTSLSVRETRLEKVFIDVADIRFLRALLQGEIALIHALDQYNIDVFLKTMGDEHFLGGALPSWFRDSSRVHLQWIFSNYPELLRLKSSPDFAPFEQALRASQQLYIQASDGIFARAPQTRRLFNPAEILPVPDTEWVYQTVVTFDGQDAAQSGNVMGWDQPSVLAFEVTGPGTLEFQWKLLDFAPSLQDLIDSNFDAGHWIDLVRFPVGQAWNVSYMDGIYAEQDWTLGSVVIPSGTYRVEFQYGSYGLGSLLAGGAFVDAVSFVPEGGSAIGITPGASLLEEAVDAMLGVTSMPINEDAIGWSQAEDLRIREDLNQLITALDSTIVDGDGLNSFTLLPLVQGLVDPADLRPSFYLNTYVAGSLPDPTFAGVLPNMQTKEIEGSISAFSDEDPIMPRFMDKSALSQFFGFELSGTLVGENQLSIIYDTDLDSLTEVRVEATSDLSGLWRYNGDGLGADIFETTDSPENFDEPDGSLRRIFFKDLEIDGSTKTRFYRTFFDFGN